MNPDGTPAPPAPEMFGRLEVTITDRDIDDAVLRLRPNIELTASVHVEGGELQDLIDSTARSTTGTPSRPILGLLEYEIPAVNNRGGRMQDDGSYAIHSVARSVYGLSFAPLPEGMYLKSVHFQGRDVTHSPLDLTAAAGGQLEIVVAKGAASVSGIARDKDGKPVAGATVAVWPQSPDRSNLQEGAVTIQSDASGAWRFEGLTPGAYSVAAWEDDGNNAATSPQFRALFTSQSEKIQIDKDAQATQDVEVIPTTEVQRVAAPLL